MIKRNRIKFNQIESVLLVFFWSSSLVVRAHTIKCGEMGCLGFEPRPLHIICNIPIN